MKIDGKWANGNGGSGGGGGGGFNVLWIYGWRKEFLAFKFIKNKTKLFKISLIETLKRK